ncbi:L-seryl-tRNA(Ser) seleniumtransferase [Halanaerobium saccharolyticum]|uniref:L-seryl-tRNA(Ser) seleniumtransferase n=1 Tax=Halanaerobium saccharolyticum TaxID=43595 RepID=A0A4R6LLZ2_9FIRM|nr:aminotransferase class V-fold PLP-dependent enzyme [Halanaerobium saccharolyticum]TDO85927.1 L-seryl-tRNA(Ser) seleniumtransferase [Halanaerobium saccharolyticum]
MVTYNKLGVKKIINAAGTYTKYSGSLMKEEVLDAMKKASKQFVDIDELLTKSGQYIAGLLDVEAALITAGAAAGLALSTAACIAGNNKYLSRQLPLSDGLKNEFIVMKSHRNPYDQAVITAGGKFVEIGNAIETFGWELEGAVNEKTAGVFFFVQSDMFRASLTLKKIIEIAHRHNLPVIVDAAAELPPKENLTKFVNQGADIVLFSGGKDLRGPQSSGLMLGRQELLDKCRANGYPNHALGRPMKLDKETIMGLTTAIELYLNEDQKARMEQWEEQTDFMYEKLKNIEAFEIELGYPDQPLTQPASIPRLFIEVDEEILGFNKEQLRDKLAQDEPVVIVETDKNHLLINPHMLQRGEEKIIVKKFKDIIKEE